MKKDKPAKRAGKRGLRAGFITKQYEEFLQLLYRSFSQRAAARICRINEHTVSGILRHPATKVRQDEIRKEHALSPEATPARQAIAEVGHARAELCEMAVHGEGKKPGRLRATSLLLQSHGLIDAPGPKANAQANALVGAPSGTMAEIYRSKWLRDKETALAQQLEAEFSTLQLESHNPTD